MILPLRKILPPSPKSPIQLSHNIPQKEAIFFKEICMDRSAIFMITSLFISLMPLAGNTGDFVGSIYAIERYKVPKPSYLTEGYDVFCLGKAGFKVEIPWDAIQAFGDPAKGQLPVELIDMGMIECPYGWDLHEMGNIKLGSGGSEWIATYNDEYLVRFTALKAEIIYSDDTAPTIRALVHPIYCDSIQGECIIDMKLPI